MGEGIWQPGDSLERWAQNSGVGQENKGEIDDG